MNTRGFSRRTIVILVLALLAGSLVLAAVVLLARGDGNSPIQVLAPSAQAGAGFAPPAEGAAATPGQTSADRRAYISGAVRHPGVYPVQAGDRLLDLLAAAGGANSDAELAAVNLARRVRDEGHYHIPRVGEPPPADAAGAAGTGSAGGPAGSDSGDALIDLNTAPAELLATLPGIGPDKAKAIVKYREQRGPFRSVAEIINVSGIGPATYERVRHLVKAGPVP